MKALRLTLLGSLLLLTACPGVGDLLRLYGYTELRPPSTFFAPGTMVWVKSQKPFTAGIICTQRSSLGDNFQPLTSPTEDANLTKAASRSFELDAQYMEIIKGNVAFSSIDSVTAQMQNPLIYTVDDVDIIDNVGKRDPVCTQAVEGRKAAGYKITMISNALMGDVLYTVTYKTNVNIDVAAKIAMLQNLALELKIQNATVTENTIQGKGLFWGVQDDTYLAGLGIDPNSPIQVPPAGPSPINASTRIIPANITPQLDYTPDAP